MILLQAPSMWSCSDTSSGRLAENYPTCHGDIVGTCQMTTTYCRPLPSPQPQARASSGERNIFKVLSLSSTSLAPSSPPPKRQCFDQMITIHCKAELREAHTTLTRRDDTDMAARKPFDDTYFDDELPDLDTDTDGGNAACCTVAKKERVAPDRTRLVVGLDRLDDETASYCCSNSLVVGSGVISIGSSSSSMDNLPPVELHHKPVSGSDRKRPFVGPVVSTTVCKKTCEFRPVVSSHLSCSSRSSCSSRHFTDIFQDSGQAASDIRPSQSARTQTGSEKKPHVDAPRKCRAKLAKLSSKQHTSSTALLTKLFRQLQPKSQSSSSNSDGSTCASERSNRSVKERVRKTRDGRHYRSVRCRTQNPSSDSEDSAGERDDCQRELALRPPYLLAAPLHALQAPADGRMNHAFSDRHTEMVECCLDEGSSFLHNAVVTLRDFTTARRYPTVHLLRRLLTIMMESTDREASYHVYRMLNEVRMQHPVRPGELPFTWSDIQTAVTQLQLPLGVYSAPANAALSSALALQYMAGMLEDELFSRPITAQRQVTHSVAYRLLSAETKFSNVKKLLQWISDALHFGQYCEAGINSVLENLRIGTTANGEHDCGDVSTSCDTAAVASDRVPKILPVMQRLLNLVIIVSRCPEDCAKRIAIELERLYMHLPTLFQRHLLVTSITSRLLRLKLVQRILEDHCSNDSEQCGGCDSGAICLNDLITCYFCCVPPQNLFTPPPTPERDDDVDLMNVDSKKYSPESCEELSMLLYTVLDSYIAYSRGTSCHFCIV